MEQALGMEDKNREQRWKSWRGGRVMGDKEIGTRDGREDTV